jgi:hypothetical protein
MEVAGRSFLVYGCRIAYHNHYLLYLGILAVVSLLYYSVQASFSAAYYVVKFGVRS